MKYYRDLKNSLDTARDEGIEEGREEGIQIGEEIGIEKGKRNIARQMKLANESVEKIIQYTGLTAEQMDKL